MNLLTCFTPYFSVFIVNFEQVMSARFNLKVQEYRPIYPGLSKIFKMECFLIVDNGLKPSTISLIIRIPVFKLPVKAVPT